MKRQPCWIFAAFLPRRFVTNEGIEYLRTYLNLPSSIVPETLKKSQRSASRPAGAAPGGVPASAPAAGTGRCAAMDGTSLPWHFWLREAALGRGYGGAGAMEKASAAPSGYSAQFGRGGGGYGRGSA